MLSSIKSIIHKNLFFAALAAGAVLAVVGIQVSSDAVTGSVAVGEEFEGIAKSSMKFPKAENRVDLINKIEGTGNADNPATTKKDSITPETAKRLLHEASLITNIGEQASAYRKIIQNLCAAGFAEQAWQMILAEPGYNRGSQLWAFFASAEMDLAVCSARVSSLYDAEEKSNALATYFGANSARSPNMLDDPIFQMMTEKLAKTDPNVLTKIVGEGLRNRYDHAKTDEEREKVNQLLIEMHSKKLVSNEVLSTMIIRNSDQKDGFELWPWISDSSMGATSVENMESNVRASVIQGMVFIDASRALNQIVASKGEAANYDLSLGLTEWARYHPKAANDWYQNQRWKLTQVQQDSAAKSFAMLALSFKELQGAESWADQIQDADLRNSIQAEIRLQQN